ncbi:MAG: hypothetical protein QM752_02775 [Gammaproteobacteria bacterium]
MRWKYLLYLLLFIGLTSCTTVPPRPHNIENACSIFQQYPDWQESVRGCQSRWGVPAAVQMAIMYQESAFEGKARPPRRKLFCVIPWKHISSAYGYSQALNGTWADYAHLPGNVGSKRQCFDDASDFVGWYCYQAHKKLGIPLNDAYSLYLAYHEGMQGYAHHSYLKKPWLMNVAKRVEARAKRYQRQLEQCNV